MEVEAQGLMDIFSLLSKENVNKIKQILDCLKVETSANGEVTISFENLEIKMKN